jgi:hypothetical protein
MHTNHVFQNSSVILQSCIQLTTGPARRIEKLLLAATATSTPGAFPRACLQCSSTAVTEWARRQRVRPPCPT